MALQPIREAIAEVVEQLEDVKRSIEEAEAEAGKPGADQQHWRREEKVLRREQEQLRKKEGHLLWEKELLVQAPFSADRRVSPELVDFWRALPHAEWFGDGKFMSLVKQTSFFGYSRLGNKLYNRKCYQGLERELETIFAESDSRGQRKNQAVAVIGHPGIGKSIFGYLLLYRWACEGRRVVVVKRDFCNQPVLFTRYGAYQLDEAALSEALSDPEVRYLVDGVNPGEVGCLPTTAPMVLVTYPDRNIYHSAWKTAGYLLRYMDVWSWEEMAECREGIFSHMPLEEVAARYDRWGGSPRYVLEKVERASQNNLEWAIGAAHVDGIQDALGMQEFPAHAREDILHMRVGPKFIERSITMASPYVSERIAYKLWRTEKEALRTFLGVVRSGKGHLCSVRANLWEGFCHARLARGGEYRIRDLMSAEPSLVHQKALPSPSTATPSGPVVFDDWPTINGAPDGVYLRPRSRNQVSVDSAMQPNILFQIAASKTHDLECSSLERAVNGMKQSAAVELYFLVPPDYFMEFKVLANSKYSEVASLSKVVKFCALEVSF